MDILTYAMAKSGAKAYTDAAIAGMAKGFDYKGSKPTAADLPTSGNKKGDCWTTTDTGAEYIWDGIQWIELGRAAASPEWGKITGEIANQSDLNNALSEKIKLLGNVDDPSDPGYGFPYHFPYDASFTPKDDSITIGLKTITLDNNKYKMTFDKELPAATDSSIGLMKAADATAVRTTLPNAIEAKQDKLTAGNNISIENNIISSVSKTYMPLKDSWKISSTPGGLTLREFCTAINNDSSVVEGNAFCGNINSNNFFEGMYTTSGSQVGSAEVSVQIMGPWQDGHVQLLTVTSSNNPPYFWQYTWVDGLASWVSWSDVRPVFSSSTNQLLDYVSINGEQFKISHMPSYTAADEGKVLKIMNGVPTWVSQA